MSDRLSIYNGSAYTIAGLSAEAGCTEDILRGWIYHDRTPRKKNKALFENVMDKLKKSPPPIKFHPSYGYATEEQMGKLRELGLGIERDSILRQIEIQTKNNGKYK